MSMERCVGTNTGAWRGLLGLILQLGRCIVIDTGVRSSVLGPIGEYGEVR